MRSNYPFGHLARLVCCFNSTLKGEQTCSLPARGITEVCLVDGQQGAAKRLIVLGLAPFVRRSAGAVPGLSTGSRGDYSSRQCVFPTGCCRAGRDKALRKLVSLCATRAGMAQTGKALDCYPFICTEWGRHPMLERARGFKSPSPRSPNLLEEQFDACGALRNIRCSSCRGLRFWVEQTVQSYFLRRMER